MAKRSTIGENPLDAMLQENPLDTVVPDLTVVGRGERVPAEALSNMEERVVALEATLKMLKTDASGASAAAAALKEMLKGLQEELARLRQDIEQAKAAAAASQTLAAEMAQLKEELAQVRASSAPGDLPFWMRGKKK